MSEVIIPEYITVHLGDPDEPARNVTVPFIDYIKNVASSEIYPTWPENAIRANVLAQVSFALNRIYTEWYRSRGYDFDITSSTRYDQKFIEDRDYFDSIVKVVDDVFNDYVVKQGTINPYFTQYCNGTTVTCPGLSQWGTVDLANQGLLPYEILQFYYGDDINIVFNAPTQEKVESYPGIPLKLGTSREDVRIIQRQLNRISDNYPAIPKISSTDGVFDVETEAAVRKFQEIFNLTVDGIVGKSTWYKIKFIYNSVKKLGELVSEGISPEEAEKIFPGVIKEGDTGFLVQILQYYLNLVAFLDEFVPSVTNFGTFDSATKASVIAFQTKYGLDPDGIVGRETWNKLVEVYRDTVAVLSSQYPQQSDEIYPGRVLTLGTEGDDVKSLQRLLQKVSDNNPSIERVEVTGVFDEPTENVIKKIQSENNLPVNGLAGPLTWNTIVKLSK